MSLKPQLGDIATPGRGCPPHNETYDCRIHPNGIGCLRRGGGSGAGRLPDRPDRSRHSGPVRHPNGPQRSVSDPGERKAPGGLHSGNAPKNEREEARRIPQVLYPSGDVPRPGRQNRKCGRGESRVSASPGARKARATGFWGVQDRSFPTEMPDEPGISVKHFSTPKPKI